MKLAVLALDYDGTVARHDRLDAHVREAIADARTRGIVVLIDAIRARYDLTEDEAA